MFLTPTLAGLGTSLGEEEPGALETFVEDNGLLVGLVVLLVGLVVGVVLTVSAFRRHARQKAMVPTARKYGLEYSSTDPFDSTAVAFPVFRKGDGRAVENVMWRAGDNGKPVRVFDYAFYEEYRDDNGNLQKSWTYLSCAMAQHGGLWPPILVARERLLDRAAQKAGLPDIELESEEFNRMFVVQCEDRRFATDLLGPAMMELLVSTEGKFNFETKGRFVLVTAPRLEAHEMPPFLNIADEFVKRIPDVVWDLYPAAPDANLQPTEGVDHGRLDPGLASALSDEIREERARATRTEYDLDGNPVAPREQPSPRPRVEYDLDGNPVTPREENPWG